MICLSERPLIRKEPVMRFATLPQGEEGKKQLLLQKAPAWTSGQRLNGALLAEGDNVTLIKTSS